MPQVEAMELRSLAPNLPALLAEMGVSYDPERLALALKGREIELSSRAVQVASMLGGCIAAVAKVRLLPWLMDQAHGTFLCKGHLLC